MKRRIISIGLAFLTVIGLFPLSACGNDEMFSETYIQDKELENEVKHNIKKLSKKARENINYQELFEDIDAVNNRNTPIYALPAENKDNQYEMRWDGEGYYCKTLSGGEVVTYVFYSEVGDKRIYTIDRYYQMSVSDEQ